MTAKTTVTIEAVYPDGTDLTNRRVVVQLIHGGAGGTVDGELIAERTTVPLTGAGPWSIALYPTAAISPSGCFYRFTIDNSSPTINRDISVPASGPVSWTDAAILLEDPVPPVTIPAAVSGTAGQVLGVVDPGDGPRYDLIDQTGGGAVDSVNGQTGVVVLDADDIGDGTTNKAYTAAEQSKLAAITGTNTGDQTLPTLSSLGAVPTSRTLAGLDLSADRTASALRTALGLVIGTDVQAHDADLDTIAGLTATTDNFIQAKAGAWASRTVAQVKTDLGVGAAAFYVTPPIGDYIGMTSPTAGAQGISNYVLGAAGRGNISPIWLPTATYDRIGVYVSSGGTATLRLGLYSANATTGLSDTKVLDAGTISTVSTGLIEATISSTLGGWYWAAVVTDAYTSTFDLMGYGDSFAAPIFGMASNTGAAFRQRVAQASSSWTTGGLTTSPPSLGWAAAAVKVVLRRSA